MFDIAAHRLAQDGFDVLGGYMSPVNDAYGKAGLASAQHRVNMCQLASADSPLVMVDGWEAAQPQYQNSLFVLRHVTVRLQDSLQGDSTPSPAGPPDAASSREHGLQDELARTCDPDAPRAMLLCGADLLESFVKPGVWRDGHVRHILEQHGVVCVARKGSDAEALLAREGTLLHELRTRVIVVTDPVQNDTSSTVVRDELAQGRPVRYLTSSSVVEYIQQHRLYRS
ncbi:hypothetical protein WJX73_001226 [Symbiochloris irregularis]|uniref:Nicotinamide/nicotinic acid mononucleotide adenylyltransferase 3 n=1 Tax=Symbiochloris irregularis TaxID=706552 RepID=A0AAW1PBU6_9CHLO